jgi:hypothetical protein
MNSLDMNSLERVDLSMGMMRTNSDKEPKDLEVIKVTLDQISDHFPKTVILDPRQLDEAVIGLCVSGPVPLAVYDFERLVVCMGSILGHSEDELYEDDEITLSVIEFVEYNTIRCCDYTPNAPMIWENMEGCL